MYTELLGDLERGTKMTLRLIEGDFIVGEFIIYNEVGIRVYGSDGSDYIIPWTSVGVISF